MVLMNFVAFVVFNIFYNLAFKHILAWEEGTCKTWFLD